MLVLDNAGLLCFARMLRKKLRDFESSNATLANDSDGSGFKY